jgi:hypothetical protein
MYTWKQPCTPNSEKRQFERMTIIRKSSRSPEIRTLAKFTMGITVLPHMSVTQRWRTDSALNLVAFQRKLFHQRTVILERNKMTDKN